MSRSPFVCQLLEEIRSASIIAPFSAMKRDVLFREYRLRFRILPVLLFVLMAGCAPAVPAASPTPTAEPATATPEPTEPTDAPQPTGDAAALTVQTAPIVPTVPDRMREVYAQGIANGRNPDVFTKVGDCMTAAETFLVPYAGDTYDLGEYAQLQEVIDHFSAATIREVDGQAVNSFSNPSLSVSCGFNSAGPIDPLWADPDYCEPGESSLTCELRVSNAAFVLIMLGTHDMHFEKERFKGYLEQIVQEVIDTGAVPILTTFPPRSDELEKAEDYNSVLVEVAREQQVPLANLWLALHDKPNYGVQPDHPTALSLPADQCAACFSTENMETGATLQNWVALMALLEVWQDVSQ
jgi:hypothetical protein